MNILIGTDDIAGWMQQYKNGLISLGHNVTTLVTKKSQFFENDYDYIIDDLFTSKMYFKPISKYNYISRLKRKLNNYRVAKSYKKFIHSLIQKHDLYIQMWHPLLEASSELAYAKSKNKKVISIFVGSDVRYFNAFKQEFDVRNWNFPDSLLKSDIKYFLTTIRNAERYSDLIYSVPDQAGLQLRPYYHLQVPLNINQFFYIVPNNKIPKIVHAPSEPFKKGTDIIEATLEKLSKEGIEFEFISVRNMPNKELLKLLSQADILIDEIVFNGPGALSFEGMLSGCAVATRYIEDSPEVFRPPVWNINAGNIYYKLKKLLTDRDLRIRLAEEGRAYAVANNDVYYIVKGMLADLEFSRPYDYIPAFLRENYQPCSKTEIELINHWTDVVKDCAWYKKNVKTGIRAELIF